jgi:hypothetical protein
VPERLEEFGFETVQRLVHSHFSKTLQYSHILILAALSRPVKPDH